jgi:hypothetical protein
LLFPQPFSSQGSALMCRTDCLFVIKAIIYATLHRKIYGAIVDACFGIAFLSTPHQGSDVTPFPNLLASLANFTTVGLFGNSRSELIKMLEKDAPGLAQLSSDFTEHLAQIKIASFVEQHKTAKGSIQVSDMLQIKARPNAHELCPQIRIVDSKTGTIGNVPGERYVPMQGCDHKTVCLFSSRNHNYKLVLGILREWCDEATGVPMEREPLSELQLRR